MIEAGKPKLIKERNLSMIEGLVSEKGPITKPELAELSQLSLPTVNKLMTELEMRGIVCPVETESSGPSKVGRRAVYYKGNSDAANVITVFYMDGKWTADVYNYLEKSVIRKELEVDISSKEKTLQDFFELVDSLTKEAKNLKVIGVGIPGVVTGGGEILACSSIPAWIGLNLREEMKRRYECAIIIENDVNLMTLGYCEANSKKADDIVFLFLGRGIGAGVVINRKLHRGFSNFAGEFGYMPVSAEKEYDIGEIEYKLETMRAQIGKEPQNQNLRENYYLIISRIIISCIVSVNPEQIILHGSGLEVEKAEKFFLGEIRQYLPATCIPKIKVTTYGEYGIRGLVHMCLSEVTNKYWLREHE